MKLSVGKRLRTAAIFKQLGPGLITGAADDDPSGIATYSQAGAQFGFNMLWTMALTYPLMVAVQLVSARVGRVTGCGLAKNLGDVLPRPLVLALVASLFIANTINIGANLSAMGAATQLVIGGYAQAYAVAFAALSLTLQMFISYERYARYLKWLTLVLFAYVAVLFVVKVDWGQAATALVMPQFPLTADSFTVIVAILGTTISPYLLFWQSSQEVEEIDRKPEAQALRHAPLQAKGEMQRIQLDTLVGMAVSNLVALAIMMSAAATLHAQGKTHVGSAAEAAEALRPVAGELAFALFSLGLIGTGLLSLPVLAGSAAYAFGEAQGWKCGLDNKPWEAAGFLRRHRGSDGAWHRHRLFPLGPHSRLVLERGHKRVRSGSHHGRHDVVGWPARSDGTLHGLSFHSILWLVSHSADGGCGAFDAGILIKRAICSPTEKQRETPKAPQGVDAPVIRSKARQRPDLAETEKNGVKYAVCTQSQ